MYNLIEYSLNYSETTGTLWLYSNDEATNFNVDIFNDNNFKSFKYQKELLIMIISSSMENASMTKQLTRI